jgi:hypothetical protein
MNKHAIQLITVCAVIASDGGLELQARHDDAPTTSLVAASARTPLVEHAFDFEASVSYVNAQKPSSRRSFR